MSVKHFTVATIQTLHKKRADLAVAQLMKNAKMVFVDECHGVSAATAYKTMLAMTGAYYRIGVSATPLDREDGANMRVIAALGPVIFKHLMEDGVDVGVLAKPVVQFVRNPSFELTPMDGSWLSVYEQLVVRSTRRNQIVASIVDACGKPALVFVEHVEHGRILKGILDACGWRTEFVWGIHSGAERMDVVERLQQGKTQVVISSRVFQQGVDIPELRTVVNAAGGKAAVGVMQRIGRGMRTVDGKTTFEVYDIKDESHFWLQKHSVMRQARLKKEGCEIVVVSEQSLISRAQTR